jgi:hypothetical protein
VRRRVRNLSNDFVVRRIVDRGAFAVTARHPLAIDGESFKWNPDY